MSLTSRAGILPGLGLSCAIATVSVLAERLETRWFEHPWVDGLVFAILIGSALRTLFALHPSLVPGVHFSSKMVLEIAIVLLGGSISFSTVSSTGPLFAYVAAAVVMGLATSYAIGRLLGLSDKLATLVACGNSICGNSAIVAAAPVIDAPSEDVAASVAFTAALGIVVVLLLPLAQSWLGLSQKQYGVVAGMTVYAVPQVLAATMPVGIVSTQIGAIVKLMRVLMLGPVVFLLGLYTSRGADQKLSTAHLVPWFIIGFVLMIALRSLGVISNSLQENLKHTSAVLTIVSMAALGLTVDIRTILASGGRVLATGVLSLLVLVCLSAIVLLLLNR